MFREQTITYTRALWTTDLPAHRRSHEVLPTVRTVFGLFDNVVAVYFRKDGLITLRSCTGPVRSQCFLPQEIVAVLAEGNTVAQRLADSLINAFRENRIPIR